MNCCKHTNKNKKCKRNDGKIFTLPRKFTRKICLSKKNKGFTMRSSCAPYKMCKKKEFLFNPNNPKKSFDTNILGTFNYLESSRHNGVKNFIFSSSGSVFGDAVPPMSEETLKKPILASCTQVILFYHVIVFEF